MAHGPLTRRLVLRSALATAGLTAGLPRPAHAQAGLRPTAAQTQGPYYPSKIPADADNDLIRVAGRDGLAAGIPVQVSGRVLDTAGRPVPGALVEIWQCDAGGRYHHVSDDGGSVPRDPNFQGYGRTRTDVEGAYLFRTLRPAPYPGRAPHIHFAVRAPGLKRLVTQMYVEGEPANGSDGVLNGVRDPLARAALVVPLRPATAGLAGRFDIVLAAVS